MISVVFAAIGLIRIVIYFPCTQCRVEMIPALRQLMVAMSPQLAALSVGGSVAYPTQLLQQLKTNESSIHLDIDTSSWIGSIYGLAGIPVILLPMLMQWQGRKFGYIITCIFVITGWVLSFVANNTALILISEAFQGLGTNSLMPVSCLSMTEMLAPKYRFLSMQLFGINITIGMAIVGILGRFVHFKTISLIMIFPVVVAVAISVIWPESPPWLACKGEFDKCTEAFIWLRGDDEESKTELNKLITAQKENLTSVKQQRKTTVKAFWNKITSRDFYMPSIHIFILMNMLYSSGGDVVLVYFLELVEKSTHNQDAVFYAGIVMYVIVLLGSIITNITVRRFKNKTVLILSTLGVILSLICACIVTYMQSVGLLAKDSLLCMYCLIGYMVFYSLGLNAIVFYIGVELMPVKHRSIGGAFYIITNCGLYALTLKIAPYFIEYIGMWRTFLILTVNAILCTFYVWKYVPETKGRTLQELEDFYMYGKFINRPVSMEVLDMSGETPMTDD